MPIVVPTITEEEPAAFSKYAKKLAKFAPRIHVDLADGIFAPHKLLGPEAMELPAGPQFDLHLMYKRPYEYIEAAMKHSAYTTIVHAEAEGDLLALVQLLHESNLRAGLALLPESLPDDFVQLIEHAEQVLIFGGKLGWQGGDIDLEGIEKIARIKQVNPRVEIAWDGGVDDVNIVQLVSAGVDVINTGGFIKNAKKPEKAYGILQQIANR